jgi:DNA-binding NarL/FixJ family response regulator
MLNATPTSAVGAAQRNYSDTRVLLLVEDNPGDAELVEEMLAQADREGYQIIHVPRLFDAVETLKSVNVDVVVLDLKLPDCSGVEGVKAVREAVHHTPIVVLTGTDDETLALECINAGAQDYLAKGETRARNLKRAIGYAISRVREAQVRDLQHMLSRYRALSSAAQGTPVTASLVRSGAISIADPEAFERLVFSYYGMIEPYVKRLTERVDAPRSEMKFIISTLGDHNGGPRDLLDIHIAALDRATNQRDDTASRSVVFEARLLALEMMGMLVDYYRVGHRQR